MDKEKKYICAGYCTKHAKKKKRTISICIMRWDCLLVAFAKYNKARIVLSNEYETALNMYKAGEVYGNCGKSEVLTTGRNGIRWKWQIDFE